MKKTMDTREEAVASGYGGTLFYINWAMWNRKNIYFAVKYNYLKNSVDSGKLQQLTNFDIFREISHFI